MGSMTTLWELRQQRGLSRQALAHRARVSVATIYRIETGTTVPRPSVVRNLCAALELTPEQVREFHQRDPSSTRKGPPPTVLVVDDDAALAAALTSALTLAGYRVRSAPDGKAALKAVTEQVPDLVLADVVMPELDGYGLVAHLRALGHEMPVVLMSGYRDQPLLPGVRLLAKPFTPPQLLSLLAKHFKPTLTDTPKR